MMNNQRRHRELPEELRCIKCPTRSVREEFWPNAGTDERAVLAGLLAASSVYHRADRLGRHLPVAARGRYKGTANRRRENIRGARIAVDQDEAPHVFGVAGGVC